MKELKIELVIHRKTRLPSRVYTTRLRRVAEATLHAQGVRGRIEIGLVITDDREMRALQARYLRRAAWRETTDVLSFAGPELVARRGEARYLGDVVISYPQARRQAKAVGQGIQAELELLFVHGLLHLLGYDHKKPKDREKMWAQQEEILARILRSKRRASRPRC